MILLDDVEIKDLLNFEWEKKYLFDKNGRN